MHDDILAVCCFLFFFCHVFWRSVSHSDYNNVLIFKPLQMQRHLKVPLYSLKGSPVLPEGSPVLPEGSPVLPEGSPVLPEGSPVLPERFPCTL